MTRRTRRRLLAAALTAVVAWLAASALVVGQLTARVYRPFPEPPPAVPWGSLEAVRLTAADGLTLGAWFAPGRHDRPAVVLVHGNGGSRRDCLPQAGLAAGRGCPVLLLTARAHGDSDGEANDFGYSARHDVAAAVGWLAARQPGRPVAVWGQSLGAAAAVFAAQDLPPAVVGYVLECPYADLNEATWNRLRLRLPAVPAGVAYAGMRTVGTVMLPHADRISPREAAGRVPSDARVLVLAGEHDRMARPTEAAAVAERLGSRAELVIVPGGGHLGLERADPAGYRAAVERFLDRLPALTSAGP